jgi:uncharacterized membrane protein YraQ (UPF0718 family)/copper chaperone CopZ
VLAAIWDILLELAPWLLLGTAIAALLHGWVPRDLIRRQFQGPAGVAKAVLFGVPMPLCSCGVIPAGLGLKRDGASDGATLGFLISTPQTGVDSILVSASFLGWPFALFKVASAAVTGLVGGWWAEATSRPAARESVAPLETEPRAGRRGAAEMVDHGVDIPRSIWRWLVFGVVVSAAITVLMPPQALAGLGRFGSLGAGVAALVVSLPLYVCATASVPIAAALVAAGMPAGAALVFLMAGPATNVAEIGAVYRALGGRVLTIYLTTLIVGSLGLGVLFDGVLGTTAARTALGHEHGAAWWSVGSAAALLGLLAWFATEDLRRLWNGRRGAPSAGRRVEIPIDGMTCQNCVRRVETALRGTDGVDAVEVTLEPGRAVVSGSLAEARLRETIAAAGYRPL